jgi:hypothetical protein
MTFYSTILVRFLYIIGMLSVPFNNEISVLLHIHKRCDLMD